MDIRSLRYFIAVYEEGSLSAAAKRCFVAQPSISNTVSQLEEDLGTKLFVRHSKGVSATDSGTQLYPHACKMVNDMSSMRQLFHQTPTPLSLSISLAPFLSGALISQVIKTMLDEVSGLTLKLVDESESADLRFTCHRYTTEEDVFYPLWEDDYVIAMPLDHWLSDFPSLSIKQIDKQPFISRTPCDIFESWHYLMQKQELTTDVRAQVKTEEYALDLVAAGLGISLIPEHSSRGRKDLCLRPLNDVKLKRVVGLAHQKSRSFPAHLINTILAAKQQLFVPTKAKENALRPERNHTS
ncbi:LysR family transcriptional regulator [Marinomonas aquiplantarum]|uniref:DNA-binding transcriptional LysR family regulator n=1 Tax=Marinomonas aquiplantarum TaxID=491951 RepID=A0A366D3P4_9GAMM|nr:LysR family transcriptional regulator [Marinomonas aquiplantarum]RBO84690.1 DNA-binding transcriptional LysR family regulator [Marinomonas aquiplantarum]